MNIDLLKYQEFVAAVTSDASNYQDSFDKSLHELREHGVNPSLLLTASIGLASETGEFSEIVKKLVFQGKEFTEDVRFHLLRELGDVAWYWTNACRSLNLDPNSVIAENVNKLQARYPNGEFSVFNSENRSANDL